MAQATDYLKAMQINDISELLYHIESHVIDQAIDQATKTLSKKLDLLTALRQLEVRKFLLPLKKRSMQWFLIFQHQSQSIIRI